MLNMGPLELLVLRNEFQEIHPLPFLQVLVFHHFHRVFPPDPSNISIDAFTGHIAVERLGEVRFNAVPALRGAFLEVLQEDNSFWKIVSVLT